MSMSHVSEGCKSSWLRLTFLQLTDDPSWLQLDGHSWVSRTVSECMFTDAEVRNAAHVSLWTVYYLLAFIVHWKIVICGDCRSLNYKKIQMTVRLFLVLMTVRLYLTLMVLSPWWSYFLLTVVASARLQSLLVWIRLHITERRLTVHETCNRSLWNKGLSVSRSTDFSQWFLHPFVALSDAFVCGCFSIPSTEVEKTYIFVTIWFQFFCTVWEEFVSDGGFNIRRRSYARKYCQFRRLSRPHFRKSYRCFNSIWSNWCTDVFTVSSGQWFFVCERRQTSNSMK